MNLWNHHYEPTAPITMTTDPRLRKKRKPPGRGFSWRDESAVVLNHEEFKCELKHPSKQVISLTVTRLSRCQIQQREENGMTEGLFMSQIVWSDRTQVSEKPFCDLNVNRDWHSHSLWVWRSLRWCSLSKLIIHNEAFVVLLLRGEVCTRHALWRHYNYYTVILSSEF